MEVCNLCVCIFTNKKKLYNLFHSTLNYRSGPETHTYIAGEVNLASTTTSLSSSTSESKVSFASSYNAPPNTSPIDDNNSNNAHDCNTLEFEGVRMAFVDD